MELETVREGSRKFEKVRDGRGRSEKAAEGWRRFEKAEEGWGRWEKHMKRDSCVKGVVLGVHTFLEVALCELTLCLFRRDRTRPGEGRHHKGVTKEVLWTRYPVLTIKWMDFSMFPTFPPKILGGFPWKTTLWELLGTTGLEPADCRVEMLSTSHK